MGAYTGSKCGEEGDVFYLEIEERIMLVIADEEEEELTAERAPLRPIGGDRNRLPPKSFLLDAGCGASVGQAKQWDLGCYGSGRNRAWTGRPGRARLVRLPEGSGRKGTGVFIPRCAAAYRRPSVYRH